MRYIKRIGVEIEGGWNRKPPSASIYADGSVSIRAPESGEISSPPSRFTEIKKFLRENYPSDTNSTCGMHIHLSFYHNGIYSRLMTEDFYHYFLVEVEKWGKENEDFCDSLFWDRLKGENSFCRRKFNCDEQVEKEFKDGCRYAHLNYCFTLHNTIEVRIFPAFKQVEAAISALRKTIEIFEEWLKDHSKREKRLILSVKEDAKSIKTKEKILCV